MTGPTEYSHSRTFNSAFLFFCSRCRPAACIRMNMLHWIRFDQEYRSDWRSRVAYSILVDITPKLSCVARLHARPSTYYSGHSLRTLKGRNASVPCLLQRLVSRPLAFALFALKYLSWTAIVASTNMKVEPSESGEVPCS